VATYHFPLLVIQEYDYKSKFDQKALPLFMPTLDMIRTNNTPATREIINRLRPLSHHLAPVTHFDLSDPNSIPRYVILLNQAGYDSIDTTA
jgi:hypothetical protein